MRNHVWMMALALACARALAAAEKAPADKGPGEEPLTVITSERLTFDYKEHFALFEENVVVTDPEIKILADKMTIVFDDKNAAKSVKAEGHVILVQLDKKAESDTAIYDVVTGEIQLLGNPRVTRGKDVLTGDTINFWRNENRMKVNKRAKLVLGPDGSRKSPLSGALP